MTQNNSHEPSRPAALPPTAPPTEVEAEAIDRPKPVIPPNRRISWLGWLVALLVFRWNMKFGIVLVILLVVFKQYPTINLKNLPHAAGTFLRKLRR